MQSVHVDRRLRVKSDARNPPSPRLRGTTRAPPSASLSTSRSADASRPRTNWTARQTLSFRNQWDDSSSAFGVALVLPLRRSLAAVETRSRLRRSLGSRPSARLKGRGSAGRVEFRLRRHSRLPRSAESPFFSLDSGPHRKRFSLTSATLPAKPRQNRTTRSGVIALLIQIRTLRFLPRVHRRPRSVIPPHSEPTRIRLHCPSKFGARPLRAEFILNFS